MYNFAKKTTCLFLAVLMLLTLLPASAFPVFAADEVKCADALNHDYAATVTYPTGVIEGYTDYTCSACGDTYRTPWLDETAYVGMTIACVGDSITAAYGVTKDETDYVTLLAEQLGMDYIRLGVSGTTLCTDGSRSCNIGKLTEASLNGADVVTIAMGINDFAAAGEGYYELGDINSTDTSTIYGATRMWCERIDQLRQTDSLKDTEFYFMTPVITSWNSSVSSVRDWDQAKTNIHGYTLRDLCNAIIEVCALYELPVIDLNLISGLYYNSAEDNTVTEFGGDGVHPGTKGHEMMASAIANALLQNNLRDDHEHAYGSWITTTWPSCSPGEQQRVCSVCTATESKKLDGKGHAYENSICTICGAEHPNLADYSGKVISVMGDSISTFAGYIPVADGFNREHLSRYPQDDLLTDVNETWWMQLVDQLDAKLGINDSWRGATLCGAVPVTTGDTGENAAMSNLTRIQNLGSNGTPDVILLYGGTNDLAHVSKVGSFDPETAPTEVDLSTKKWDNLADGFLHTLLRMKHYYPDAQILAMLPTYTKSYYSNEKLAQGNAVMAEICEHYGIAYVDLRDSGVTAAHLPDGIHPSEEGMDMITEALIEALLSQCEMEKGENVVYSVTHSLKNVKASLGHYKGISAGSAFTEALEGDNLSVSVMMSGTDITESCYADGKIHIPEVSGPLLITAESSFSLGDRLQQLPEGYQGENLWPLLRHDADYYTADGWGVHSSGTVKSVTIPVKPGDRLVASSFGAAGSNGASLNGIRVTFFSADGLLISMAADKVYGEYSQNGYLTVPDQAVAVSIPMWKEQGAELYFVQPAALIIGADGSEKEFSELSLAMASAKSNDTVKLLSDASLNLVYVLGNVTLDLNGRSLTAGYAACFGNIIDDSTEKTGLLKVAKENLLIQSGNKQLPVRDGDGYRFFEVLPFNQKLETDTYRYAFQPRFEEAAHELLALGASTGISIQVAVSWEQGNGTRTQNFIYTEDMVREYINSYETKKEDSYAQMFTLTLKGAEGYDSLDFSAVIVSDTGVSFAAPPLS